MPLEDPIPPAETDSIFDFEGNVYKTVRIGDQWWMAENLRSKYYRDGSPLYYNQSMPDSLWGKLTIGAFCNSGGGYVSFNGLLYNWHAVSNPSGLAPEGWHIPTDDDWKQLEISLGMSEAASDLTGWRGTREGEKMKAPKKTDDLYWAPSENVYNSNESGFSALPGGCRLFDGTWGDINLMNYKYMKGFWWSSSGDVSGGAWYRYLDYKYSNIFRYYADKSYGFSIRCVKDQK
jgi:uncharacterized protein (TIGR02145 family)